MNTEIISGKLLLISILFSLCILTYLSYRSIHRHTRLIVCNNNDKLTILIQIGQQDILLNPISVNETLECLGKNMAFYDKTIDIAFIKNESIKKDILKYYQINKTIDVERFKVNNIDIEVKDTIKLAQPDNNIVIAQKKINAANLLLINVNDFIIQTGINTSVVKLIHLGSKSKTIKKGEIYSMNLESFF